MGFNLAVHTSSKSGNVLMHILGHNTPQVPLFDDSQPVAGAFTPPPQNREYQHSLARALAGAESRFRNLFGDVIGRYGGPHLRGSLSNLGRIASFLPEVIGPQADVVDLSLIHI